MKMDIEGYERKVIKARNVLGDKNVRLVVCTYHNQNDEVEIIDLHESYDLVFKYERNNGHMLFFYSDLIYPYFRRGILRVEK